MLDCICSYAFNCVAWYNSRQFEYFPKIQSNKLYQKKNWLLRQTKLNVECTDSFSLFSTLRQAICLNVREFRLNKESRYFKQGYNYIPHFSYGSWNTSLCTLLTVWLICYSYHAHVSVFCVKHTLFCQLKLESKLLDSLRTVNKWQNKTLVEMKSHKSQLLCKHKVASSTNDSGGNYQLEGRFLFTWAVVLVILKRLYLYF